MPVACSTTVLTGQDGAVYFTPAGTQFCLLDYSDFGAPGNTLIAVPTENDYALGDPVRFSLEGSATLDTAYAVGTTYYVRSVGTNFIELSASPGGVAIASNGDGGTVGSGIDSVTEVQAGAGYADGTYFGVSLLEGVNMTAKATVVVAGGVPGAPTVTTPGLGYTTTAGAITLTGGDDGNGNGIDSAAPTTPFTGTAVLTARSDTPAAHVNIDYAEFGAICNVREFTLEITREELDVTTLPCGGSLTTGGKYLRFRRTQAGYGDSTGSMTVYFTADQTGLSNRLLRNVMLRSQEGAKVELYVNHVTLPNGEPDRVNSLYVQAPIAITSMSLNVNPDDPQEATVDFKLSDTPTRMFGITL